VDATSRPAVVGRGAALDIAAALGLWRTWTILFMGAASVGWLRFPYHPGERVELTFGVSTGASSSRSTSGRGRRRQTDAVAGAGRRATSTPATAFGRRTTNRAPPSALVAISIEPPCRSAAARTAMSPRPVPSGFDV
jgi:hypothetical protein